MPVKKSKKTVKGKKKAHKAKANGLLQNEVVKIVLLVLTTIFKFSVKIIKEALQSNLVKNFFGNKKVKIVILVAAIGLASFVWYKAFVYGKKVVEKRKCLNETPWQTLEGITLCDSLLEAGYKTGSYFNTERYWVYGSGKVDVIRLNTSDKRYIIAGNEDGSSLYKVSVSKTYEGGIIPNHEHILKEVIKINNKPNKSKVGRYRGQWCWGDCYITHEWIRCKEEGSCFKLTYQGSVDGDYNNMQIEMENNI